MGGRPSLVAIADAPHYRDSRVRDRIREYCGIRGPSTMGCVYLCTRRVDSPADGGWAGAPRHSPDLLDALLDRGLEISRSLWDRTSLSVHLDVDYLNVDHPDEPFTHPAEVFFKLEATYQAVIAELAEFELHTLAIATGGGYHFTGQVPLEGNVADRLARLVPLVPHWHGTQAMRRPSWLGLDVSETEARAVTGLGLVLEHLVHGIVARAAARSRIPVVLNGTIVGGRPPLGRECISIDLTQFADPFDVRHARVPFSVYRKAGIPPGDERTPHLVALPRGDADLVAFLEQGRDSEHACRLARETDANIPDSSTGLRNLLDAYDGTALARFHREFLSSTHAAGRRAADRDSRLPPCVAACLETPNDLLLKPAHLQNLTRALLARGWTAREIATLVVARYLEDHAWGDRWRFGDAYVRGEGYVRLFAGMIRAGADRLIDFNCVSTQEKGMCPGYGCSFDLREDAHRLESSRPA